MWVADPLSYDFFNHYTSPVYPAHRRDDNVAQTSTRLAKEGKARARRNLGIVLPH
jgi:hypothetical protein